MHARALDRLYYGAGLEYLGASGGHFEHCINDQYLATCIVDLIRVYLITWTERFCPPTGLVARVSGDQT